MNREEEIKKAEENLTLNVQARWELLLKVTTDAVHKDQGNLAAHLGVFLVYTQRIEEQLNQILSMVYSFKSYFKGEDVYVYISIDRLKWDELPMGGILERLKSVTIKDNETKKDLLKPILDEISKFKGTRNGYIHRIMNDKNLNNLEKMREDVINWNKEMLRISGSLSKVIEKLRELYSLNGKFESVEKHVIFVN